VPLPMAINLRIASHPFLARVRGQGPRIPLVLMLELTHACNLRCAGRIREYAATRDARLDLEQGMAALAEAKTPVLSISGREPLLHAEAPALARQALGLGKVAHLCTNALLLEKRLAELILHRRFAINVYLDGWPLNIYEFASCARSTLVPLLVVLDRHPRYAGRPPHPARPRFSGPWMMA
jgi:MoaA/NifB/PqqE/SkfB family radical SAM enzyme